jgi:large subunit ribosomal protein L31
LFFKGRCGTFSLVMKKEIHPENFRKVIFLDVSSGEQFLIASTVDTEETGKWTDGKEYPLYRVEISSASHPFYTGTEKALDTAGRAEKFRRRAEKAKTKVKA